MAWLRIALLGLALVTGLIGVVIERVLRPRQ